MRDIDAAAKQAIERFRRIMALKATASKLAIALRPIIPGIDFMGCSKGDIAQDIVAKDLAWVELPDWHDLITALETYFGSRK